MVLITQIYHDALSTECKTQPSHLLTKHVICRHTSWLIKDYLLCATDWLRYTPLCINVTTQNITCFQIDNTYFHTLTSSFRELRQSPIQYRLVWILVVGGWHPNCFCLILIAISLEFGRCIYHTTVLMTLF